MNVRIEPLTLPDGVSVRLTDSGDYIYMLDGSRDICMSLVDAAKLAEWIQRANGFPPADGGKVDLRLPTTLRRLHLLHPDERLKYAAEAADLIERLSGEPEAEQAAMFRWLMANRTGLLSVTSGTTMMCRMEFKFLNTHPATIQQSLVEQLREVMRQSPETKSGDA